MASWLGGLMMGLGGAAAGGFKAAGEVQDEKIKDRSDMLKMEAMATREESLARLRARYQAEDTDKQIAANKEIQGMNFAERTKAEIKADELRAKSEETRIKERYEDKKDQRDYQRQMLEARGSGGDKASKGQFLTDAQTGKVFYATFKDNGPPELKEVPELSGKTQNNVQGEKQKDEIIKNLLEYQSNKDFDGMRQYAKFHGIPTKDVEKITKKGIFSDDKITVPEIDFDSMRSSKNKGSLAAPSSGMNPAEPGTSTGKPGSRTMSIDEAVAMVNGRGQQTSMAKLETTGRTGVATNPEQTAELPKLSMTELDGILNQSTESQAGPYKTSYKPGETRSIGSWAQGIARSTQPENDKKFGEGELEFAIRQKKKTDDLPTLKDMAENLRKQFPNVSDADLAKMVLSVTDDSEMM